MAAPKPSAVTRISSQTHPMLVTVETFHPGLCHEGIESATVTRILWQLTQGKEHDGDDLGDDDDDDDDDENGDDDEDDDGDDDDDDDDFETPRATQTANHSAGPPPPPANGIPSFGHPAPPSGNCLRLELACGMVGWFGSGLVVRVIIPPPPCGTAGVLSFGG